MTPISTEKDIGAGPRGQTDGKLGLPKKKVLVKVTKKRLGTYHKTGSKEIVVGVFLVRSLGNSKMLDKLVVALLKVDRK